MNNAYYIAANSMLCQEKMFDVISGNISNINTNGYKKTSVNFSDLMYSLHNTQSSEEYTLGSGIMVNNYSKDFGYGDLRETGNIYDLAFEQDGFLTLTDGKQQFYTRGGSFILSKSEDNYFLTSDDGYFLLDNNGDRIIINQEDGTLAINDKGLITFENSERSVTLDITCFQNPEKLEAFGNNLYKADSELKKNTESADIRLRQGHLEQSNVNLSIEMTDLIKAQRLYQMNSKVLQVMDEISGMANRLRK